MQLNWKAFKQEALCPNPMSKSFENQHEINSFDVSRNSN